MNSLSFSVISTVSDFFSSFENYTSSTCVDPLPSVPTLQYSNATVNQQQNMYFYLFANLCFQIFECCSRCVSEMADFCSSTLDSFATTVSSNVNDFVLSPSDVFCPVPASQSQDSNDTVKINCFIVMFLIISVAISSPDI